MFETTNGELWDVTSEGIIIELSPDHYEEGRLTLTKQDLISMLEVYDD